MEDFLLASSASDSSGSSSCGCSSSSSGGFGGSSGDDSAASASTSRSRRSGRTRQPTLSLSEAMRWRKCWLKALKASTRRKQAANAAVGGNLSSSSQQTTKAAGTCGTISQSNNQVLATSEEEEQVGQIERYPACGAISQSNNQLLATGEEEEAEAAARERRRLKEGEEKEEDARLEDRDRGVTRMLRRLPTTDTNASADESAIPTDSALSSDAIEGEQAVDGEGAKEVDGEGAKEEDGKDGTGMDSEGGKVADGEDGKVTDGENGKVADGEEGLVANAGPALVLDDEGQSVPSESSPPKGPDQVFADLGGDGGSQTQSAPAARADSEQHHSAKSELANVIEKAILDFCSSRTVETMRRIFAGATSENETLQRQGGRPGGDKSAQAPHPVTGELVKEGIVIGTMDVFAPRVHREYRLEMRDSLVEGFLKDAGVFRAICYRTKCQLEVTRRLLNKKLCTGGRWVKYLIVRIVGPTLRAISCCDQLLQKAVPAFKNRIAYPKTAFCRLFFREDVPDNSLLYSNFQRTGGTSNRYGALRLETPYRATTERTVGNCPWKSGSLKVGKLAFTGAGTHLCMKQMYPSYGYGASTAVEPACPGVEAVHRIEQMHNQSITRRHALVHDRRMMTIPVCR